MNISSVLTPFRIVFLFILVTLAGVFVIPFLSVNLVPEVKSNGLIISFGLMNNTPLLIEGQITSVIENSLSGVSQLKDISSSSEYNKGKVRLIFDKTADMQFKIFEVRSLIRSIYPNLPPGTSYPEVSFSNDADQSIEPLLIYTISGPAPGFQIRKTTEDIFNKAFANLKGISNLSVRGSGYEQVTISFDNSKCITYGINPNAIRTALNINSYTSFPGSIISAKGAQFFIQVSSLVHSINDLENLHIINENGTYVKLKDIATVVFGESKLTGYYRINQKTAITLQVSARQQENKIVLANQIKDIVKKIKIKLPQGYEVTLEYDNTGFLKKELSKNYERVSLSILILLIFILITYRNGRYLIVLFSSLVVNLALTFLLVYLTGLSIHLYTIAGLAIAFGIMIDNAIVMIDYYHQHKDRSVFLALLASTLTTIAALCLIFLLPDEEKNKLEDFAFMIVLALTTSMPVALWFTPAFYELLFSRKRDNKYLKKKNISYYRRIIRFTSLYYVLIQFVSTYRKSFLVLVIIIFGLPIFLLPAKWEGNKWYQNLYNNTIGSTVYQHKISPVVNQVLGGSIRLFADNVYENSGYRTLEKTKLFIVAELPFGSTLKQMNNLLQHFENYLAAQTEVEKFITTIQSGQYGAIQIEFPDQSLTFPSILKANMIALSLDRGGVKWNIYGVGEGFTNKDGASPPDYRVKMTGYNYQELEAYSELLAQRLSVQRHISNINTNAKLEYYEKPTQEYILRLNEMKLALTGINKQQAFSAIKTMADQTTPKNYVTFGNHNYPVILEEKNAENYSSYSLLNDPIQTGNKKMVVRSFGNLTLQHSAGVIKKENRKYVRMVSFEYSGARKFGEKYMNEAIKEVKAKMPVGFTAEETSWFNNNVMNKSNNYLLLLIIILSNFFICSILFEGLIKPLYIILMIPISFIGLFLSFSLGGFYFDQGGYAAFVMLGGLVVNAAIFIVNDFHNIKKKYPQKPPNKLLMLAVTNRSRTIFTTTVATCCGLLPFLMEGQNEVFWFSLAIGTIGGLIFSLVAVFLVLPVLLWKSLK